MPNNYTFLSDLEPSDEQLSSLMKEVAKEAEVKAENANALFWAKLKEMVKNSKQEKIIHSILPENEGKT